MLSISIKCQSMPINTNQYQSIPINTNQYQLSCRYQVARPAQDQPTQMQALVPVVVHRGRSIAVERISFRWHPTQFSLDRHVHVEIRTGPRGHHGIVHRSRPRPLEGKHPQKKSNKALKHGYGSCWLRCKTSPRKTMKKRPC